MKIVAVETFPIKLSYILPPKLVFGEFTAANHLLITVKTDDGLIGYGYAAPNPTISGESQASASWVLARFAEALVGYEVFNLEGLHQEMNQIVRGNLNAKAALEMAFLDLLGKYAKTPVCNLLGGRLRDAVRTTRVVPLGPPETMRRVSLRFREEGYTAVKLKMDGSIDTDVQRVKAVRTSVGRDLWITVDANMAYTPKKAINLLKRLQPYEVDMVEQPIPAEDLEGLAQVSQASSIPILADESVVSPSDAYRLAKAGAVDAMSLKIPKMGGILPAKRVAAICEAADIQCLVGTKPGGMLTDAAHAHLIASTPNLDLPCEVGEFVNMKNDPAHGLKIEMGLLKVPTAPGLGVQVRL